MDFEGSLKEFGFQYKTLLSIWGLNFEDFRSSKFIIVGFECEFMFTDEINTLVQESPDL